MARSRFNRKLEKESKRNFILSLFGIILILFLLFKFGVPLLANFALFLSNSKETTTQPSRAKFLTTPVMFSLPSATNSAQLVVKGKAESKSTVDLYINDKIIDKTQAAKNGDFSFRINLEEGSNKIFVKSKLDKNSSDPSDEAEIVFDNTPPELSIDSPSDGQNFSGDQNLILVNGNTDSQTKVTVNGFWAIVDQNNKYSYTLLLKSGDNEIKVEAVDEAGNKSEKKIIVKYSP